MLDLLRDLYAHQAWADAEVWRAIEASPTAASDQDIRSRLHHLHETQHAFLQIWRGVPIKIPEQDSFASLADVKAWGRSYHRSVRTLLQRLHPPRLLSKLDVPWFKRFPKQPTVGESMHQVVMHSMHHRGQTAARLRSLGGSPPMTDFILWVCTGRPAAKWN